MVPMVPMVPVVLLSFYQSTIKIPKLPIHPCFLTRLIWRIFSECLDTNISFLFSKNIALKSEKYSLVEKFAITMVTTSYWLTLKKLKSLKINLYVSCFSPETPSPYLKNLKSWTTVYWNSKFQYVIFQFKKECDLPEYGWHSL